MKKLLLSLLLVLNLISCTASKCIHETSFASLLQEQTILPVLSFVKVNVFAINGSQVNHLSSGSGFFIEKNKIITAKHVCDTEDLKKLFELVSEEIQILFTIDTFSGESAEVRILKIDSKYDLCLLGTLGKEVKEKNILNISDSPAKIGEKVYNLAAPIGLADEHMVPIFYGFYSGDTLCKTGTENEIPCSVYTVPTKSGSSGSPILNHRGELIGVVYLAYNGLEHVGFACTHEQLSEFLK